MSGPDDDTGKGEEGKPTETPPVPAAPAPATGDTFSKDDLDNAVADALKSMKERMDALDAVNKELKVDLATQKQEAKAAEIERLRADGKEAEALLAENEDLKAELAAARNQNTELTRDQEVSSLLTTQEFRGDRARKVAIEDITKDLIRNDSGQWEHKNGTSVKDHVEAFCNSEDNKFLFKQKTSGGTGQGTPTPSPTIAGNEGKSLIDRPLSEAIALAQKGQLPNQT